MELKSRLTDLLEGEAPHKYITPLFWQHGESRKVLLDEIMQMHSAGVNGFIMEARPFPEFLEESWWDTVEFALQEAAKRDMKVFVFDDIKFPSGFAAGRIRDCHPEYLKIYLKESHMDCYGPMPGASFPLKTWLKADEALVRVITVPVSDNGKNFDATQAVNVTGQIASDGILYWDIPEGRHRIFLFIRTREGGENHTKDYLNPLEYDAIRTYIDTVYEPHYQHFAEYFGNTFSGFFSDEPRFGNAESYEATLGKLPMVIPFSSTLMKLLSTSANRDFSTLLPCLWYDGGDLTAGARSIYMDVVSRQYAKNFTEQIGDWCRKRQVKYIGHLVEDNGAHSRLGYGTGHFFRAIEGQDWSGMDAVFLQLLPEYTEGMCPTPFGSHDSTFFYWGLTKLATSAGHLDPKKRGTTFCESFGAYGWQEGLKLMTWLTNHFCVRGINHFVPHAFSPMTFPDVDCPPHFYARGFNPQWRYFKIWADYANRICHLLSDGCHIATAAVIYHAEAEWTGCDYDPFEKVIKVLAQQQIDCDVIPVELLLDSKRCTVIKNSIKIHEETYSVIIVPYSECLPKSLLERLEELACFNVKIVFMRDMPRRVLEANSNKTGLIGKLRNNPGVEVVKYEVLARQLQKWNLHDIKTDNRENDLRCYHYVRTGEDIYFFVNESTFHPVETSVQFSQTDIPLCYNPMNHSFSQPEYDIQQTGTRVEISLAPYESVFVIFGHGVNTFPKLPLRKDMTVEISVAGPWKIGIASAKEFPDFSPAPLINILGNIATPKCLPDFSGTIRYETRFELDNIQSGRIFLDLGSVYETATATLNGKTAGVRIAPPYRMEITKLLHAGKNHLQIDITNTLDKQHGNNIFDQGISHEPVGLIGPVQILRLIS